MGINKRPVATFRVNIPDILEKDGRRQIISLNAFCNGFKGRKPPCITKPPVAPFLYFGEREEKFIEQCEYMDHQYKKLKITHLDNRELPCSEHSSIWEFYKFIGYDYKTRKWSEVIEIS
jgi:hypothetical protein